MDADKLERLRQLRREPPPLRRAEVASVTELSPFMKRIVVTGQELADFELNEPAASIRILVPTEPSGELEVPTWNGNVFELSDGDRAPMRTFTPRYFDPATNELTVDFVLHEQGVASDWARIAGPGDELLISGPGRGESIDPDDSSYLFAGDESAMPAIGQLIESVPDDSAIDVHIELSDPRAEIELPEHAGASVTWHVTPAGAPPGDQLVNAVRSLDELPDAIWIAGEAQAIHRIRTVLFDERGRPRSSASVRGYWKNDR